MNAVEPDDRNAWTTPGVFEVAAGVHRLPLPLPNDALRAVNVYVVDGDDGPVLIDSGWAITQARDLLEKGLRELGHTIEQVQRFLVTHAHRDHYTQAISLRREFGTRVSLGADEQPSLAVIQDSSLHPFQPQFDLLMVLGAGHLLEGIVADLGALGRTSPEEWDSPDDWLQPEQVIVDTKRSLTVIATPGHTRGHVVFHDLQASILFAGDHVLPAITPSVGFEPVLSANPLGDFLASLGVVRAMPDALLLPAHGPVSPSVHARVDELLTHHHARLEQTLHATRGGGATGLEVASQLRWTRRGYTLDELDAFNTMLAIVETGAHLDLLVAQGRVRATSEQGVRHFQAVA